MKDYDVIVIGGGIRGFTASAFRARAGLSMGVFDAPGHCCAHCDTVELGAHLRARRSHAAHRARVQLNQRCRPVDHDRLRTARCALRVRRGEDHARVCRMDQFQDMFESKFRTSDADRAVAVNSKEGNTR